MHLKMRWHSFVGVQFLVPEQACVNVVTFRKSVPDRVFPTLRNLRNFLLRARMWWLPGHRAWSPLVCYRIGWPGKEMRWGGGDSCMTCELGRQYILEVSVFHLIEHGHVSADEAVADCFYDAAWLVLSIHYIKCIPFLTFNVFLLAIKCARPQAEHI